MDIKEILHEGEKNEIKIELNTGEGIRNFILPVSGCLKAVILKNEIPIDVTIKSEYGYQIYKEMQHVGVHYFPLKITSINHKAHQLNFQAEHFELNENIIITIQGRSNVDVLIILRMNSYKESP